MKHKIRLFGIAATSLLALVTTAGAQGKRSRPQPPPPPASTGVYANASGTIVQFNYNRDAMVEGFLLSDKTLVHFPPNAIAVVGPALHVNDNVEVAGLANSSPSGLRTIEAQQVKDKASGKTFTLPQPGPAAPYSGSGRIQQLNYGPDGAVNGFLLDNGTLVDLPPFSAANPSSIRSGVAVSFTGYARSTVMGRTVVDVQTLSLNGQKLTIAQGARGAAPPQPPPPPAAVDGGGDEPPPPPPPPAAPPQF